MVPSLLDTDTLSEIVKLRDVVVVRRALAYTRQVGVLTHLTSPGTIAMVGGGRDCIENDLLGMPSMRRRTQAVYLGRPVLI